MNVQRLINLTSILLVFILSISRSYAQPSFSHADTLRGSNGPFRQKWDVLKYEITVKPDFITKSIEGINTISFFDKGATLMQIDLQLPMLLDSVTDTDRKFTFRREGNVYWLEFRDTAARYKIKPGIRRLNFYFHGTPREAINAPWDGGWIWKKDMAGNPFVSVACQDPGASVWFPCKDSQADEPDSGAVQHIIVPDSLVGVGNGRLTQKRSLGDGNTEYSWVVKSPINNYCIIPYIGKYVHFGETFKGEKGKLDMDYWVLEQDLDKAKKQFTDAPRMMKAFEYWFGPYPFYEDGYKLVQAPHLGMEHQSATAYGNGFQNGYFGKDLSETGWGLKWDFIIVHESGHEWFANSITSRDIADMWIHESFTNYSETLFTEFYYGKAAGNAYVQGIRKNIDNDIPIIGNYAVNNSGSIDMYYKGGNIIHYIRQIINNDNKFRSILRGLNKQFYHKTVTTGEIENYISKKAGINLSRLFDQYLRTTQIPVLEYKIAGKTISFRWINTVDGFNMPVKVSFGKPGNIEQWIKPTTNWQSLQLPEWYDGKTFILNSNFYITTQQSMQ